MNLIIEWVLTDVASDQRPLLYSKVELRADPSFPFKEVARVPAPGQGVTLPDLPAGTYEVRLTAVDAAEVSADPSDVASITLTEAPPVVRPPGKITGVKLTQS